MKLDHILNKEQLDEERRRLDPKCWKGYKKQGTKMKGDTRVNNCVPESVTTESKKDTHCSDKCCGADVKREDCKCPADCPHCNCNDPKVAEGKSPHKKGTKKYKKHMAAMHAGESVTNEAVKPTSIEDLENLHIRRYYVFEAKKPSDEDMLQTSLMSEKLPNEPMSGDMVSELQDFVEDGPFGEYGRHVGNWN